MTTDTPTKRKFTNIDTVTLIIGDAKDKFEVHKTQLCEVSKFFSSAFESTFKEGKEQLMNLPDDDVEIVDVFIQWLYTRQYTIDMPNGASEPACYSQPIRLLLFADKYDVPSLEKQLYTTLINCIKLGKTSPKARMVKLAYMNTCNKSSIRMILADWFATLITSTWMKDPKTKQWLIGLPEFSVDLMIAMAELKESGKKNSMTTRTADYLLHERELRLLMMSLKTDQKAGLLYNQGAPDYIINRKIEQSLR